MANQIVSGDIVEVTLYCTAGETVSANVLHYACASHNGTGGTDLAFATAMSTLFSPAMRAAMSVNASFLGCKVQIISPTRRPAVTSDALNGAGTVAGQVLPLQVCGLIQKRTNVASRRSRGRFYVPFPSEGHNDDNGVVLAGYVTLIDGIANLIDDTASVGVAPNDSTLWPVVYSRVANGTTLITGAVSTDEWATQRKRGARDRGDTIPVL